MEVKKYDAWTVLLTSAQLIDIQSKRNKAKGNCYFIVKYMLV